MNPDHGCGYARSASSRISSPKSTSRPAAERTTTTPCRSSLNRRFSTGLDAGQRSTCGRTASATPTAPTKPARPPTTTVSAADYGSNQSDVRQSFNLSALYELPYGNGKKFGANAGQLAKGFLGGWQLGGLFNARTGLPIEVLITRPDIVYQNNRRARSPSGPVVTNGVVQTTSDHQRSRRRKQPQHAPAGSGAGSESVRRERRNAVGQSRRPSRFRSRARSATSAATRCAGPASASWT